MGEWNLKITRWYSQKRNDKCYIPRKYKLFKNTDYQTSKKWSKAVEGFQKR